MNRKHQFTVYMLDFRLSEADGRGAPVTGELTLHCFPDKITAQAIYHVTGAIDIKRAEFICDVSGLNTVLSNPIVMSRGDAVLGIAGGTLSGNTVRAVSKSVERFYAAG